MADTKHRILARHLYDGVSDDMIADQMIDVAHGRIVAIRPADHTDLGDASLPVFDIVAPGFIDLQINGAADRQFNFDPTPDTLEQIATGARQGGTAYCLPTFITAAGCEYVRALEATQTALARSVPGVLGVHLEGPFLSRAKPGIHNARAIRVIEAEDIDLLVNARAGTLLLTVAPETLPDGALARLAAAGIRVFAGHSDATADQIAQAEAAGLVGVTHLFNAMSQMTGRAPGVVGAVLASDTLYAGIIADGHHVDWRNVDIAARLMPQRLCLVTDAMLTLAGSVTSFDLDGTTITKRDGRLTNAAGRLAGAHVSMIESVRNMLDHTSMGLAHVLRLATSNPARALGLETQIGVLHPGHRASLTCLTKNLDVAAVVIDGRFFDMAPGASQGADPASTGDTS
ncbi:N-acetylglucosamine-6-phosphate deacetylase [Marivita sp. S0852]|uniref:N-acetylglucosamine-6-phosphate deacetylase n=1 Tax=Marivita sp. S0852 TaxID=3373893 RepID=UPI0039822A11